MNGWDEEVRIIQMNEVDLWKGEENPSFNLDSCELRNGVSQRNQGMEEHWETFFSLWTSVSQMRKVCVNVKRKNSKHYLKNPLLSQAAEVLASFAASSRIWTPKHNFLRQVMLPSELPRNRRQIVASSADLSISPSGFDGTEWSLRGFRAGHVSAALVFIYCARTELQISLSLGGKYQNAHGVTKRKVLLQERQSGGGYEKISRLKMLKKTKTGEESSRNKWNVYQCQKKDKGHIYQLWCNSVLYSILIQELSRRTFMYRVCWLSRWFSGRQTTTQQRNLHSNKAQSNYVA